MRSPPLHTIVLVAVIGLASCATPTPAEESLEKVVLLKSAEHTSEDTSMRVEMSRRLQELQEDQLEQDYEDAEDYYHDASGRRLDEFGSYQGGSYTSAPTSSPTSAPTAAPTSSPTSAPTAAPTSAPIPSPTTAPTPKPTAPAAPFNFQLKQSFTLTFPSNPSQADYCSIGFEGHVKSSLAQLFAVHESQVKSLVCSTTITARRLRQLTATGSTQAKWSYAIVTSTAEQKAAVTATAEDFSSASCCSTGQQTFLKSLADSLTADDGSTGISAQTKSLVASMSAGADKNDAAAAGLSVAAATTDGNGSGGLSAGEVAAIVIGTLTLLGLLVALAWVQWQKKASQPSASAQAVKFHAGGKAMEGKGPTNAAVGMPMPQDDYGYPEDLGVTPTGGKGKEP